MPWPTKWWPDPTTKVDPALVALAGATRGFMPDDEGMALHRAGLEAATTAAGPLLEIGTYCGKSALYLGAAAKAAGSVLFTVTITGARRRTSRAGNTTTPGWWITSRGGWTHWISSGARWSRPVSKSGW